MTSENAVPSRVRPLIGLSTTACLVLVACASGGNPTDGGGGGSTTNATGSSASNATGTGPGGEDDWQPPSGCTELTGFNHFYHSPTSAWFWTLQFQPNLGGPDGDVLFFSLSPTATGSVPLTLPADLASCYGKGANCAFVAEDDSPEGPKVAYVATSGTIDLSVPTPPYISGALTHVVFEQVDTAPNLGAVTLVPGGKCYAIKKYEFSLQPPPPGWHCAPVFWQDYECTCGCGAVDIDCPNALASSCSLCNGQGSCNNGANCPANIDPNNNAICD